MERHCSCWHIPVVSAGACQARQAARALTAPGLAPFDRRDVPVARERRFFTCTSTPFASPRSQPVCVVFAAPTATRPGRRSASATASASPVCPAAVPAPASPVIRPAVSGTHLRAIPRRVSHPPWPIGTRPVAHREWMASAALAHRTGSGPTWAHASRDTCAQQRSSLPDGARGRTGAARARRLRGALARAWCTGWRCRAVEVRSALTKGACDHERRVDD